MTQDKIVQTATLAGRKLLESGAETYRVEDTVVRLLTAYDMDHPNCFSTLTGLMVSATKDGKSYAQVARIKSRSTNLDRIVQINDLSRSAKLLSIEDFEVMLSQIVHSPTYTIFTNVLFAFLACFGFNLLFSGAFMDSFFAGGIGLLIRYLTIKLSQYDINSFFSITTLAALSTLLALCFNELGLLTNYNITIVAVIMLLVPGLAITNAIYDSLAGDLVSGITRAIEALIIAISIAIGSGSITYLWIALFKDINVAQITTTSSLLLPIVGAFIASFSFGIIFNIKKQNLLIAAIGGTLGFVVYQTMIIFGSSVTIALFLAAVTFSFYSELSARIFKTPSTIFLVTSLILLVPGSGMYNTMLAVVMDSPSKALWLGLDTFSMAMAIAFGVIFASTIAKAYFRLHAKRLSTKVQ